MPKKKRKPYGKKSRWGRFADTAMRTLRYLPQATRETPYFKYASPIAYGAMQTPGVLSRLYQRGLVRGGAEEIGGAVSSVARDVSAVGQAIQYGAEGPPKPAPRVAPQSTPVGGAGALPMDAPMITDEPTIVTPAYATPGRRPRIMDPGVSFVSPRSAQQAAKDRYDAFLAKVAENQRRAGQRPSPGRLTDLELGAMGYKPSEKSARMRQRQKTYEDYLKRMGQPPGGRVPARVRQEKIKADAAAKIKQAEGEMELAQTVFKGVLGASEMLTTEEIEKRIGIAEKASGVKLGKGMKGELAKDIAHLRAAMENPEDENSSRVIEAMRLKYPDLQLPG